VRLTELVYLQAEHGYVTLVKDDGTKFLSEMSLTELEEKLSGNFIRVQKSIMINKTKISEISKYFNNRLIIEMTDKSRTRITTGTSFIKKIRFELNL
jgi:two-component system LytT family response regulator